MYSGFCAESEGVSIPGGWLYTEVSGNASVVGMRWGCWTSMFMLISVFMLDIYQTSKYKKQKNKRARAETPEQTQKDCKPHGCHAAGQ